MLGLYAGPPKLTVPPHPVIPAKAGISSLPCHGWEEIPAFAGMTGWSDEDFRMNNGCHENDGLHSRRNAALYYKKLLLNCANARALWLMLSLISAPSSA